MQPNNNPNQSQTLPAAPARDTQNGADGASNSPSVNETTVAPQPVRRVRRRLSPEQKLQISTLKSGLKQSDPEN